MNHVQLVNALRDLSVSLGYSFTEGTEERMSQAVRQYPAAWISPPRVLSAEGRRHGRITYGITLHLLDAGAKMTPDARNERFAEMENDALEIFTRLSENGCIIAVEKLTVEPRAASLTSHGEISQTVQARAVTCF